MFSAVPGTLSSVLPLIPQKNRCRISGEKCFIMTEIVNFYCEPINTNFPGRRHETKKPIIAIAAQRLFDNKMNVLH